MGGEKEKKRGPTRNKYGPVELSCVKKRAKNPVTIAGSELDNGGISANDVFPMWPDGSCDVALVQCSTAVHFATTTGDVVPVVSVRYLGVLKKLDIIRSE